MTEQTPNPTPSDIPVDPPFTHPASPFLRTEAPAPVALGSPPKQPPRAPIYSTWIAYRTQIEFGLTVLAFLMVLEGTATVLRANPDADWRYYMAAIPVLPAGLVLWVVVRSLARLDEMQRWIQVQAFGFALGATALLTFGYGFLEGAGMPHLNWIYILPLMAAFWIVGTVAFMWRSR